MLIKDSLKETYLKEELGFHERLQQELLCYPVKTIHEDGSVTTQQVKDPYFLINDSWNVGFVGDIKQFVEMMENYKETAQNIYFRLTNPMVNLEVKYVCYHQLFNDKWTLSSVFGKQATTYEN